MKAQGGEREQRKGRGKKRKKKWRGKRNGKEEKGRGKEGKMGKKRWNGKEERGKKGKRSRGGWEGVLIRIKIECEEIYVYTIQLEPVFVFNSLKLVKDYIFLIKNYFTMIKVNKKVEKLPNAKYHSISIFIFLTCVLCNNYNVGHF